MTISLIAFRGKHPLRVPNYPDEWVANQYIQLADLALLLPAPALTVRYGKPPVERCQRGTNTYIWVIDGTGVPYILEAPLGELAGECPKHTNLTGGGKAYVGGELWFATDSQLFVSGGSGRYQPLNEEQLEEAVDVFRSFNFEVKSLGFDPEYGFKRHWEGP